MAVLEWVDTAPVEAETKPAAEEKAKKPAAKKSAPKKDAE
jgi:hypothetical protein